MKIWSIYAGEWEDVTDSYFCNPYHAIFEFDDGRQYELPDAAAYGIKEAID